MTSKADDARAAIEALGKRSPDALKLGRAVSLASRVEPELLRKVRLELLPDLDAGAEADLWFSALVQSSTPLAFTFLPTVADQLRRELAESRDFLTRAWQVLSDVHEHSPAAIKLEERVTWTILDKGPAAHDDVEKELMSVVSAILTQNRTGLARWALRAVPRLLIEARQTKAAQTLLVTAAAHLGAWHMLQKQVDNNNLPATFINDLKVVLPSNLPQVEVGVRLLESDDPGSTRKQGGYVVEFSSPPTSNRFDQIRVPGTVPLLLELSWNEDGQRQVKQLSLYRGRVETIRVGGGPVTIRTAGGDVYTLSEVRQESDPGFEKEVDVLALMPSPPAVGYVSYESSSSVDLVAWISHQLAPGTVGRFQLYGQAGIGKTAVASEVARRLFNSYERRLVWLSASTKANLDLNNILNGVAVQLGRRDLRTLSEEPKATEIMSLLGSEAAIIFIDDFDVIPPKELLRCLNFLRRCHCAVIVISKRRFKNISERLTFRVNAMTSGQAQEFLQRTINLTQNSQTLENVNLSALAEFCKGNPLAMQLLVAQIEFRQDTKKAFMRAERIDRDPLVNVFERSFNLTELGDDGRSAALALSLFVPTASKVALSAVAGFDQDLKRIDEAVRRLAALKLVCSVRNGERFGLDAFICLRLLEKVKKLKDYRERFISYFLDYAEQHDEATGVDYDELELELENLIGALELAKTLRSWNELIRLFLALSRFFLLRGYWDESLRRNEQAQRAARIVKQDDLLPQLLQAAGEIYLRRGEFAKAEKAFRAVLTQFGDTVNTDVADATRRLGSIALERENLKQAKRLYGRALLMSRQLHLDAGVADNVHNIALVTQLEGKLDEATKLYDESLRLSERVGDQRSIAISLHQLGVVSREQERNEQARNFFERSLSIKRSLSDRNGMADTLHQLGLLFQTLGEKQRAGQALQQAVTIYEQLSSPSAAAAASDLAALTTPKRVAKPKRPRAKKSAAKKGAAKKRRPAPPKGRGRMGGRFGPRSRKSFR